MRVAGWHSPQTNIQSSDNVARGVKTLIPSSVVLPPVGYLFWFLNKVRSSNFYNPILGAVIYVLFLPIRGPLSLGGLRGSEDIYKRSHRGGGWRRRRVSTASVRGRGACRRAGGRWIGHEVFRVDEVLQTVELHVGVDDVVVHQPVPGLPRARGHVEACPLDEELQLLVRRSPAEPVCHGRFNQVFLVVGGFA